MIIWLTGLPCSGKTTIGNLVQKALNTRGSPFAFLDSEDCRRNYWPELVFSESDRSKNVARLVALAGFLHAGGTSVIVAAVSPTRLMRSLARNLLGGLGFMEVYLDCPRGVRVARDSRGVYEKFEKFPFTCPAPYEPPTDPELVLRTGESLSGECAARVVALACSGVYAR